MDDFDPSELRPMSGYGAAYGDDSAPTDPASSTQTMPVSPNAVPPTTGPSAIPIAPAGPLLAPVPAAPAPTNASRRAGVAIVLSGVGVGAGALLGGLWGAGSGLFFAGAASNAYSAKTLFASSDPDDRSEAVKRAVMTVVGVGLAGYLGYRARQSQKDD